MSFTSPGLLSQSMPMVAVVSVLGTASLLAAEPTADSGVACCRGGVDAQPGPLPSTQVDTQYVTVLDPLLRDQ